MRVRLNRNATEPRRRTGGLRRTHPPSHAEPPAAQPREPDLSDERRARESGGPLDHAMYTCTCGYVFEAKVSTSVACPHCGAHQAW
jgi:hypothetical protein